MLCGLSVYSVLISIFKPIPQSLTGFLVDFIPVPVISGFTSAAAITIAFGQVKVTDFQFLLLPRTYMNYTIQCLVPRPLQSLLGIHHIRRPFVEEVGDIFHHIKETK